MFQKRNDPVTLLLTERNIDLERELAAARRTIDDQKKEIDILYKAIERPTIALFNDQQLANIAEAISYRIMNYPTPKKDPTKDPILNA
jgi:hypothetical protein